MKRALMIAFHFPPLAGSSGVQRTLRFVQHLPNFGWQPLVVTAQARAYEQVSSDLQSDIPADAVVRRAFALDAARHLTLAGRYAAFTARPDRWVSWKFDGVRQGMGLIREFKPDVVWSTYPIATAHLIGAELNRRTGIPWVADFRDPMAQDGYPQNPLTWQRFKAIEKQAVETASCSMFTTPGAARVYRQRYPSAAERIVVLENGYDEDSFVDAEHSRGAGASLNPGTITLLHSGIVYPSERDPTHLLLALRQLKESGQLKPGRLMIRFRAAVHDELLDRMAAEQGVEEFIETCPPIGYRDALQEMLNADALLVLQAANCNEQIPAKVYEYLRARRPILCLTDPTGDTATVLREAGIDAICRLDSADEIASHLLALVVAIEEGVETLADAATILRASRAARAESLTQRFEKLVQ